MEEARVQDGCRLQFNVGRKTSLLERAKETDKTRPPEARLQFGHRPKNDGYNDTHSCRSANGFELKYRWDGQISRKCLISGNDVEASHTLYNHPSPNSSPNPAYHFDHFVTKKSAFFFPEKKWSTKPKVHLQNILGFPCFILDNNSAMRYRGYSPIHLGVDLLQCSCSCRWWCVNTVLKRTRRRNERFGHRCG